MYSLVCSPKNFCQQPDSKEKSPITGETYKNTTYVHVTKDQDTEGKEHVVLQYWFFYYYNNWEGGPDHEGDWEFIQLIFPANKSPQEIIEENISPDEAVYSAHLGGYKEDWENDAVEKDGDRPVVYVAQGSHANYFQKGTCDITSPRGSGVDRARPDVLLTNIINSQPIIDPVINTEFSWLLFGGKWGNETTRSPDSPIRQATIFTEERKWDMPIDWMKSRISGFSIVTEWDAFYYEHCDGDFDGIWNNVDTLPDALSDDFSAPGPLGRSTDGTITNRGDRDIKIKDAEIGGTHIIANFGTQLATIKFDALKCISIGPLPVIGPFLLIPPLIPFIGTVTCGSIEVSTEEGVAELEITVGTLNVIGTVSAGQTLKYDIVDDELRIETSGEGEIPLTINGETITVQAGEIFSVHEVQIDIKPGSDENPISCTSKGDGVIPVAILTTGDFDATTIDDTTVIFEGARETHAQRHEEDVDGDDDSDLMFHFRQNDTTLTCKSTEATLTGRTFSGDLFIGTDSIDMKDK